MVFNVKQISTPGVLADDAFMQQLKLFGAQKKAETKAAPPPNSAVDFASDIQKRWFEQGLKPDDLGMPRRQTPDLAGTPAATPTPTPMPAQDAATRAATDDATGDDMVDPLRTILTVSNPALALFGVAADRLGTLTPEQSEQQTTESLDALRVQEQEQIDRLNAMTEAARLAERMKLLGRPADPQDELTDVARDLGFDQVENRPQALASREREIASGQLEETRKQIVQREKTPLKQTWWLNAMQTGARSAAETGLLGLKYPLMWYEQQQAAVTGNSERSDARAWLDGVDNALTKLLPGDKARSQDFVTKLSAGTGSYMAFLMTAYIGTVAGLPSAATAGGFGMAVGGASMYEDAERHDATGLQKFMALMIGSGLGMTEAIPIDRMFARADAHYGGIVRRMLSNTTASSIQEFTQELSQAVGEDVAAKFLIGYDEDREISVRDWIEQGLIGAVTGAAGGAATGAMRGGEQQKGEPDQARQQEQQLQHAIAFKQTEIDAALGVEPTEAPDVATDADIDAMRRTPENEAIGEAAAEAENPDMFKGGTMPPRRPDGKIELTHWSHAPRRSIDPLMRGTGPLRGEERKRLFGADAVDRAYYGVGDPDARARAEKERETLRSTMTPQEKAAETRERSREYERVRKGEIEDPRRTQPYEREPGLGPYRHTVAVDPDELYNWREDPLKLAEKVDRDLPQPDQITQRERLVKDAGFKGIYFPSTSLGQTAVMFEPTQPETVVNEDQRAAIASVELTEADTKPLPGLSNSTGPIPSVVGAARAYAESIGIRPRRQREYVKVDVDRAKRIAQAYEDMPHDPENPVVKAAYRAMIDETLAQYQFVKATGLKIDFIKKGQKDPYPDGPKQVLADLQKGHLWVFPTDDGFGTLTEAEASNPLLEPTDEYVNGRRLLANDVFRIVHDFFGHGIEGSGFGARGEENAWQSHMRLYTDAALPAVTSETRGQNSWVNYGPHGEANRANQRETVYADQKTGVMPEWTWREGVADDEQFDAMFGGENSGHFTGPDDDRLQLAKRLYDEGYPQEDIWNETGFFKGNDGKWRFEISDADAFLMQKPTPRTPVVEGPLAAVLAHDKLFEAYRRELSDMQVRLEYVDPQNMNDDRTEGGEFNPNTRAIRVWGPDTEAITRILLHEVQHAIQEVEDFGRGGNLYMGSIYDAPDVDAFRVRLTEAERMLREGKTSLATVELWRGAYHRAAAYEYYKRISGEVEARNVEKRFKEARALVERAKRGERVEPQLREVFPPLTEDVPGEQQIVIQRTRTPMAPAMMAEAPAMTNTPAFKAWFGDSKVVDESGAPLVVYHGTNAEFTAFDPSKKGKTDEGWLGSGFYFSSDPEVANSYGRKTVPAYLSAAKIYDFTGKNFKTVVDAHGGPDGFTDWLRSEGYDGAKLWSQFMVLDPTQIKSVNNAGAFDRNNPDILASVAPKGTAANRTPYKAEQTRPSAGIPMPTNATPAETSLAQIADNFVKTLDLTTRQGRLSIRGKEVMGQYSRKQAVVRLRTWGDLSTLVHEGGHALHDSAVKTLRPFELKHADALRKVADDLYADTTMLDQAQMVREGFAEFFRVYVLNRRYAYKHYPELVDDLAATLKKSDPKMATALDAIGDQFAVWMQMPSERLLTSMVVDATKPGRMQQVIDELKDSGMPTWFHEQAREAVGTVVNRLAPLNDVVTQMLNMGQENAGKAVDLKRADDPRVLAQLSRNSGSRAMVQLTDGVMPYRSTKPASRGLREAILLSQGLRADQSPRRFDERRLKDFDAYLVALRGRDEYDRYQKGIIKRPPINASMGDIAQAIADFEGRYGSSFKDAAAIVHEFGMALWKKQYEAGLMDVDTYRDGLKRAFYAPLQRDMSDKKATFGQSAITGGRSVVKQFKGSDRQIVSPTAVLMHKAFALEQIIAENDVKKALAALADRAGTAGALVERIPASVMTARTFSVKEVAKQLTQDEDISPSDAADLMTILQSSMDNDNVLNFFRSEQANAAGENIMFYWENGKLAAIQVKDGEVGADLVTLLNGIGRENFNQFGVETLAATSSFVRSAITMWPDFLIVNYIRDQFSAWILTDVGFKPFWSGARGVLDEVKQTELARSYNASLGIMGGANVAALNSARVDKDIQSLRGKGYLTKTLSSETGFLGAARGLSKLVELSETGTRLGLFRGAYERAKADGLNDWEASIEAAYTATDYMDFGLNGNRMLLARRTIPFLNAQVQGLYKMVRTLGANEVRQRKGLRFVLSSYLKSTNGMDLSRTEKLAIQTGRKAWIKMVSLGFLSAALHFAFEDDPDYQETSEYLRTTHWVIPTGDGQIITIAKPFELALIANAVERGLEYASGDPEAKNRFLRGMAFNLSPPTAPPLVQTGVELSANYDFFSGREIVPSYMQALEPALQYNNYTSELAKKLGGILNWSPMRIDHFLSNLGASAYRDVSTVINQTDPNRPSLDAADMPLVRRFVRDARRGAVSAQDFWKQASTQTGTLRRAEVSYKTLLEGGNEIAANRLLDSLPADEKAYAILGTHFKADQKRLNPFYRARQIATVISAMRREMPTSLGLADTTRKGSTDTIKLTATTKARIDEALSEYVRREVRNTLIATQTSGWEGKRNIPVEKTMDLIETVSPDVADELRRRLKKAKVYDAQAVYDYWPEVRDRLIQDREQATLDDIVSIAKVSNP